MRFDGRGGTPAYFAVAHHRDFCQVILVWWYSPVDAATLTLPSPEAGEGKNLKIYANCASFSLAQSARRGLG